MCSALVALMLYATRFPNVHPSPGDRNGRQVPFWKVGAMKDDGNWTLRHWVQKLASL